jgi:hypothetical protein
MPKSSAAEALLSLFTRPDRAASIAGDLMEEAHRRGPFWFWCNVAGTAISLLWHSLATAPIRSVALVLAALLLKLVVDIAIIRVGPHALGLHADRISGVGAMIAWRSALVPFLLGLFVARLARGREIAACTALVVALQINSCGYLAFYGSTGHAVPVSWFCISIFFNLISAVPLLGGAALVRRRALRLPA